MLLGLVEVQRGGNGARPEIRAAKILSDGAVARSLAASTCPLPATLSQVEAVSFVHRPQPKAWSDRRRHCLPYPQNYDFNV